MIAQAPIIAELKRTGFRSVEGVLEFAALTAPPIASPALFVAPEAETAQPNRLGAGVIDQKIVERFAVAVTIKAARRQETISDELTVTAHKICEALIGWVHPEASGPCELAGGRMVSVEAQHVTWAISFITSRHFRRESQ